MKKILIIPVLFFFSCQQDEINTSSQIDVDGIYATLNSDFSGLVETMKKKDLTFNNSSEILSLTKSYFSLNDLGIVEQLFTSSTNLRISNEPITLSESVQAFVEEYTQALSGKNFEEAMSIIDTKLNQMDGFELNDDNIVITLTLLTSKIVLETYKDNPDLFLVSDENGRVNSCAGDVAVGVAIGAVVGGILGGALGTFIAPGAGTVAGAVAGAKWGAIVGSVLGGAAGALIGGTVGGDC